MSKIAICVAGMSALALILVARSAKANEDWQYWSSWAGEHAVSPRVTVSALAEMYARDDMTDDYVYDEYVGCAYKLGHGFSALGQAYFETVEGKAGAWNGTRSLVIGPVFKGTLGGGFDFRAEIRFFYEINSPARWDYHRPRLTAMRNVGPVTVSLFDEMRVDLTGDRSADFYRNRLFCMVSRKLTDSLSGGVGYVRQSDDVDGSWESFHVLQTLVTWTF